MTGGAWNLRSTQVLGMVAVGGYIALAQRASLVDYDVWAALVFLPLLLVITVHLVVRAGRLEQEPFLLRLLVVALMLKAVATVARYMMAFVLYDGVADASVYHAEGARLAGSYRAGEFDADLGQDLIGTGFIRALTGALYTVTGPSVYVAYAFYAWLGFWGLYFFYRAFRTAVPDGDRRRYALLVLLLPSMLFWPSGLGKEAWMTLGLGLAAFGTAGFLADQRRAIIPLALGLVATALVRPHITAAFFAGLAVAVVVRRSRRPASALTPVTRSGLIALVGVAGVGIVQAAADFLGVEEVTVANVDAAIADTRDQTAQGGSEFAANPVNSPTDVPWAVVSVLFRPFLFEAHNAQTLVAGAEGTVLLCLLAMSVPRLRGLARRLRDQPYLIVCLVYTMLFVYAFSNFSNFGLLTRERVQVLPFVLVLLALPLSSASRTTPSWQPLQLERAT